MLLSCDDIALFRTASGDFNPLHESPEFARRTPFREPIAHGMLACLAAFEDTVGFPDGIGHLDVTFRHPVFPGRSYALDSNPGPGGGWRTVLRDDDQTCLDMTVRQGTPAAGWPPLSADMRASARDLEDGAITPGVTVTGRYGPPARAVRELAARWPAAARRLGPTALLALLWCSFLSGMEVPGRRGLLCRVAMRLRPVNGGDLGPLTFHAAVDDFDPKFGLVTVLGALLAGDTVVAEVDLEAMVLRPAPLPTVEAVRGSLPPSSALAGRTGVVVGGTRGLGAALSLGLADQGCHVLVGHRVTGPELTTLLDQAAMTSGGITLVQGDAGAPAWADQVVDMVRDRNGTLDVLICNAAPGIGHLNFLPAALSRFDVFVSRAIRLVSTPLSGLLPVLSASGGRCLAISSAALRNLPDGWSHYVTAKAAVEGLVEWAAANHPGVDFFLARPGMLLTDQMNTPAAREQAAPVEPTAAALVRRLADPVAAGDGVESIPTP